MNTNKVTIESEMERRNNLVNDVEFRKLVRNTLAQHGLTAEDWNKNMWWYCMFFANEMCAMQNKEA